MAHDALEHRNAPATCAAETELRDNETSLSETESDWSTIVQSTEGKSDRHLQQSCAHAATIVTLEVTDDSMPCTIKLADFESVLDCSAVL